MGRVSNVMWAVQCSQPHPSNKIKGLVPHVDLFRSELQEFCSCGSTCHIVRDNCIDQLKCTYSIMFTPMHQIQFFQNETGQCVAGTRHLILFEGCGCARPCI